VVREPHHLAFARYSNHAVAEHGTKTIPTNLEHGDLQCGAHMAASGGANVEFPPPVAFPSNQSYVTLRPFGGVGVVFPASEAHHVG
jgi:hypothetical protein